MGNPGSNQWSQRVQKAWDQQATAWHERSEEMWERGSRKTILPRLLELVSPENGPVLDAGCGDGYASRKLALAGYDVQGIDISPEMVQLAQARSQGLDRLRFQQGDIADLPFADEQFAAVLAINVAEFTESPLRTLLEFRRVLRPRGILLLGILGPTAGPRAFSYRRLYGEPVVQNTMMPWEAKQLARENGYQVMLEEPVYRDGVPAELARKLPAELKAALSFLTLYALQKIPTTDHSATPQ